MPKVTVWIDGVVFENDHQVGIWRLFYEIMLRLAGQVDYTLWLRAPAVQPVPPGVTVVQDHARWYGSWRRVATRLRAEWSRRFPDLSAIRSVDLFHSTYFTPCPVPGPTVVTSVYDMIAELAYPYSGGGQWVPNIRAKRSAIDAARVCLAISAATASDLTRLLPHIAERVRVVPLGADHLRPSRRVPTDPGREPFVLFVGHRDGYKNFITVVEAMASPQWPDGVSLRVVGSCFGEHEQNLLAYHGLTEKVIAVGRLTDNQLAAEYAAAACFVFPSHREGFGLPVLEAQFNGCPVVCSNIPVFREVAGDAAVFFDPRLGDRLAKAVAVACHPAMRQRQVDAGYKNVSRFSWDRAAEQTLAVYEEAAASKR